MGRDATGRGGRDRGRRLACVSALLASALAACAGTSAPDTPPLPRVSSVLLAPMNFNQQVPKKLDDGAAVVHQVLSGMLWEQDIRVDTPPFAEFHDTWLASARDPGTLYDAEGNFDPARYDTAARALVAAYRARGAQFDALLIPYLVLRPGVVVGQSVKWDSTVRRLPLEYEHRDVGHVESRRGLRTACTSLRVFAYDADGNRLFERYGGLEVAMRMKISEGRWTWTERGDLFRNRKDLEDGTRIALRPLLED